MKRSSAYFIVIIALLALPLAGVLGTLISRLIITPNDQFFTVAIGPSPDINVSTWTMPVGGHVNNSVVYDYTNFTALPAIVILATIQCVEGPSGTAIWKGVLITDILAIIEPKAGALEVVFYADDGYSSSLTLAEVSAGNIILAYEMNGVPLPQDQGYPLRVVAPDHAGYKWAKWIVQIEIVDYDYIGYWESRGWADDASKTPITDWILHAMLFSVTLMVGGVSMVSGMRFSPNIKTFNDLPKYVNKKFHVISSISFFSLSIGTFSYWIATTVLTRGSVFYTIHGIVSLISMVIMAVGFMSALKKFKKDHKLKNLHEYGNYISFIFFLSTIGLGFLISVSGAGIL